MDAEPKTAVYFFPADPDGPRAIDHSAVVSYASSFPGVAHVRVYGSRREIDLAKLAVELRENGIRRVVLAGESPGYVKPAFTRAFADAGGHTEEVRLASFGEHGASDDPTERAKAILACAILGVPFPLAAIPTRAPVHPSTLVVGGGVAGIQAALEIADAGEQVLLVERQGTIGGHMAMFDKTFPTLDCAACILTPKMVQVGQHKNIDLMVYSEIEDIAGEPGDYTVKIRKKATCVDAAACVACRVCSDVCPVSVPSEFDSGIAQRKAIYIPFPQAVPNSYLVDVENCIYTQSDGKKCGACVRKCPKDCIDLDAKDETIEVEVGNIVLATGYQTFDARAIERYGYGRFKNVLTALEFERLTNASGPTGGRIVGRTERYNRRKKADEWVFDPEGEAPKSVAIIHCVGSRDVRHNRYCSRVCCMYSLKFAHLVREKIPEATCYEFYIDMRAFGKDYEAFFERIKHEGVFVARGRTARVTEEDGRLRIKGEDIRNDRVLDLPVDMVLLSVGLVPDASTVRLAEMIGLGRDDDGWLSERNYNTDPTGTEVGGVFVAGACQGPKDIPDTVAQASAVAARVLKSTVSGEVRTSRHGLSLEAIETRARELAGNL